MNELAWLTVEQVMEFAGISRMEVYCRMDSGEYRWRKKSEGKLGREIDPFSLSDDAQQLYRKAQFLNLARLNSEPASTAPGGNSDQGRLWPLSEVDRQLMALQAQCGEEYAAAANQRYQAIVPLLNHEYMALRHHSLTALARKQAKLLGVTPRHILRLRDRYLERELIADLGDRRPGPEKGTGSILDADDRAFIRHEWEDKLSTRAQTTRNHFDCKKGKQRGCGAKYTYSFLAEDAPKRSMAVERFIDFIGGENNPRRRRNLGLNERAGYIDRTFEDEFSGDTWCIDEWELDGAFYNPRNHRDIYWGDSEKKPYLISVIDERSTFVLGATLTLSLTAETVLDLLEALVRTYGPPLRLVSDRGGHFRKGVGGRIRVHQRGEVVERVMGAMANFGVEHEQPRKKNPRGNRQERTLHGIYSNLARRDFGPSWKGANTEQRKLTEIDERVARHLKDYCTLGSCGPQILSYDDAERITSAWRDEINMMSGEASGLLGLTRQAAWRQFQRPQAEVAARRPTEDQIRQAFAEHYPDETIEPGGVITLPGNGLSRRGDRYEHPLLGEPEFARHKRNVVRYRDDHSFIIVLAAQKGEENITARRRVRVGVNDPDELSRQSEQKARLEKLLKSMTPPAVELPVKAEPPLVHSEISSVEYIAEKLHISKPVEKAPEVETLEDNPFEDEVRPSLYDYSEQCQVEKL